MRADQVREWGRRRRSGAAGLPQCGGDLLLPAAKWVGRRAGRVEEVKGKGGEGEVRRTGRGGCWPAARTPAAATFCRR